MNNTNEPARQESENDDFSMTYLTFLIDGQHYGIPISNVIEILQLQPATELPELPFYAKGVINLRGRIIALIDVNLRFGKPQKEYTDRTCVIIVDIDGLHTGLIVDTVEEVLNIDGRLTSKPPPLSGDSPDGYITRIARLDKNMVLLLDARLLVSKDDLDKLAAV